MMYGTATNNNGFYNGMGFPQGSGYVYNGMPTAPQKINNVLTNEEIEKLVKKENQFSLQLTETEVLRAKCNHRMADGLKDAITEDPITGICKCGICGYEFRPIDAQVSPETIQESVDTILDFLHTIKLLYIGMPTEAAAEYFQIMPLIEKIPKLFEYAVKDYTKHENINPWGYSHNNMSTLNLFQMLCGGGMGMAQQPYAAPQMDPNAQAAPQFNYNQPQMAPGYAMPYGGMPTNGFGYNYGMPQQPGYMPQTNGFQYNPAPAAAPQATPAAEAAPAATTVTETFKA